MNRLASLLDRAREAPLPPGVQAQPLSESSDNEDVCPDCGGFSFVKAPVRDVHDPKRGKLFPCYACAIKREGPAVMGVPDRLAAVTFENFNLDLNPGMAAALARCKAVAAGDAWCALMAGDIGCGKSHLAAAACHASVHPKPANFWATADWLAWLRQQMFDEHGPRRAEVEVIGFYQSTPSLLVLDDVGTEKLTDWAHQTLYAVLNARYEGKLPTILTTNTPEALDARTVSRFYEGAIACTGQDVRRLKGEF